MSTQHKNITEADLHEPKGVSTATVNQTYVATGAGTGIWKEKVKVYTAVLSPALVAANTTAEQTFTFTEVTTSDTVAGISKPTAQAGLGIVGWRITAADTIGITFSNNTGSGITPTASQTYSAVIYKA